MADETRTALEHATQNLRDYHAETDRARSDLCVLLLL